MLTPGGVQTVVLAAWALVQSRLTGEESVVFGATLRPNAGRDVGGPSLGPLPLSLQVSEQGTVVELFAAVAQACATHSAAPRSARGGEQPAPEPPFEIALSVTSTALVLAPTRASLASVPLQLNIVGGPEFEVRAAYDPVRFSERRVERWVDSLLCTIGRLARTDPGTPSSQVDVMSAVERRRLVHEFNATERPFPEQCCIQDLFEARVGLQPDHSAVETPQLHLSYAQLEARANQLAHLLLKRGTEPSSAIAVCLPRTAELVVALLAVLKAGATYVPLDPSYPSERTRQILEQANASLVITSSTLASGFEISTLQLDEDLTRAELNNQPTTRPSRRTLPTEPCYVMFTSGTTGGPKGVLLSHRAVVNTLDWVNRTFEVGPSDRLLCVNTPCFDLSVYDVFGALGAGATLVMADETLLAEPVKLAQALVHERISIWNSAPAALQQLVQFLPVAPPATLRLVLLSGDFIPLTLPTALRRFEAVRVISLGGATEAAIWSNWFEVGDVDPTWPSIPYGKPIQNCRYYVLNEQLEPVPTLVKGDLYISGACLAEGYLGKPELTKQRFIADPFCPGAHLYKTGDLALHREDGQLQLLGRSDLQVKVRGFRVELAEVEAALRAVPGVAHAVCEARADASQQRTLLAHVVVEADTALNEREIRAALGRALPSYMLPSRVLFHASAPLSSNGKLDRAGLCAAQELTRSSPAQATSSGTEQELVAMWQQLLGRRVIGLRENFFEIGGHSLLAVMLVARIRERLGVEIPLAAVLECPTIELLSRHIEGAASVKLNGRHVHSYHAAGSRLPLVLIPGTLGTVFTFRSLPRLLGADQPTHVVDFLGDYERSVEHFRSVEAIAEILEPEIIPHLHEGMAVLGGFSFGAAAAYELAARLRRKGYSIPLLISFDGQAPGYPKKLPLPLRMVALGRSLVQPQDGNVLSKRVALVAERIKDLVLAPPAAEPKGAAIDPELQRHLHAMGQAQYAAYENYVPGFRQPLDLLLVKARASAEASRNYASRLDYGWSDYLDGNISTFTVAGEHLHLFDDENLPKLAASVSERITRLGAPVSQVRGQRVTPRVSATQQRVGQWSARSR